ncbi:hypothetical protein R1flu_028057 [Riccia fluitans]|uniref:Uncharacterized protein n=1 Tax=Riccia fluitans TaxID=41844 RepID=A0ABD1XKL7_9MARC
MEGLRSLDLDVSTRLQLYHGLEIGKAGTHGMYQRYHRHIQNIINLYFTIGELYQEGSPSSRANASSAASKSALPVQKWFASSIARSSSVQQQAAPNSR